MKLEVGMYVRTKEGITQYKEYETSMGKLLCMPLMNGTFANIEDILKTSHNIIDLIEVGDYVNGYLIDYIDTERRFLRSERPYRENSSWYKDLEEKGKDYNMCLHFKNEDIKSIVTKEQFESIKYSLEG